MKKSKNIILICVLTMILGIILTGCANTNVKNPIDAIKKEYGDTQFKITFDSSELESPLPDSFYTANNMPVLPTPKKVGYVFAGWYFDASFTEPCDVPSGDLYWKMKDLTLYPKWEKEQIVNNGTYDIEYDARIIQDSISMGPLADGYQKFPEDIIASETYIEKNEKGIFLRIQYDNVVRGPVLGSAGSDENNFSKMTYTVTDLDNRIDKSISILDRTNNIQTIYYNIEGLNLTDTITFYVEYYNWKIDLKDEDRHKATVAYKVEFNITKFIGFNQAFINAEGVLEDGIYLIPTHYTALDKSLSMLDMFNPVYAYIEATGGRYKLYKPLNAYNNDFPEVAPEHYPLRTSGYAREFACMSIDKNKIISKEIESNEKGKYYLPEEIGADKFIPLTYEFHADTGRYYYSIDLGKTLDKDLVFIGGSSGAMEQMFSFAVDYRRLALDYNSMVRIAEWDYMPLSGDEYTFKEQVAMYPGSSSDFNNSNNDYEIYKNYKQAINMTNVFFTETTNGKKIYDTKMTVAVNRNSYNNPKNSRYQYVKFDIQYSAYDYDPQTDGNLLARDLSFITNGRYKYSNSFVNTKRIGKTYNIGDEVSLTKLYKEKVVDDRNPIEYKAYKVDDNLNVDFSSEINTNDTFNFSTNMAVLFKSKDIYTRTTLIYIMQKQTPELVIEDVNKKVVWEKDESGIYSTTERFTIGPSGELITIPNIKYTYYGIEFSSRDLRKYESDKKELSNFTKVSAWEYSQGKYKALSMLPGDKKDFNMPSEKVRVLIQLFNPFDEFQTVEFEYRGKQAGEYNLKLNDNIINSGDIKYKGDVRNKINYQMYGTFNIINNLDINKLPTKFVLNLKDDNGLIDSELLFKSAIIYTQDNTETINDINQIWDIIKNKEYALIHLNYSNDYGDSVLYKAQYNFKINSNTLDNYYFIDSDKTIFTGETSQFRNPLLTTSINEPIKEGRFKVYIKNGYNYEIIDKEDISINADQFQASISFKTKGKYLLIWEYELYKNAKGEFLFNANKVDDSISVLQFNVCQEINVFDRNAEMEITYVTDINHPFDKFSKELVGFTFKEEGGYQYATCKIINASDSFALTRDSFIRFDDSDARIKDKLFSWNSKDGKRVKYPGYQLKGLNVEMGTLNPILYAEWDSGVTIDVFADDYGVITKSSSLYLQKDTINHKSYEIVLGSLSVKIPKGYVIYGWRASKAIFTTKIFVNGIEKTVPTNFHKGTKGSIIIDEKIDFTAVLKKTSYITYEAVDESTSRPLHFRTEMNNDYGVFMGDKFYDVIKEDKLKDISKISVTAMGKELSHWEAFDNEQGKFVQVDLKEFVLEQKYLNNNGKVRLRAVFRNKA